MPGASPGQLAGCGLKHEKQGKETGHRVHHPANWPGAD
ncbi:hypothetical protein SFMTTN_2958 [Sulfuriferula multivorans]|uniref:Uncharacterized protein n=1 Tax=Sulfuriferula multivorans TaxID=1559896 RepID=A0A401JZM2_9PROT|nr:hypothetical protein SFMTTN_2958 [Sulfuriferula multivorans]